MQLKVNYLGSQLLVEVEDKSLQSLMRVLDKKVLTNGGKIKMFYQEEYDEQIFVSEQDDYDYYLEEYQKQGVNLCVEVEKDSDTEYLFKKEKGKNIYDFTGLEVSDNEIRKEEEELDMEKQVIIQKHKKELEERQQLVQDKLKKVDERKEKVRQQREQEEQERREQEQRQQREKEEQERREQEQRQQREKEERERMEKEKKASLMVQTPVPMWDLSQAMVNTVVPTLAQPLCIPKQTQEKPTPNDLENVLNNICPAEDNKQQKTCLRSQMQQLKELKKYYKGNKEALKMIKEKKKRLKRLIKLKKSNCHGKRLQEMVQKISEKVKEETCLMKEEILRELRGESVNKGEVVKSEHKRVICDGCQMNPIMGVRYKCAECEDYDLCERCEQNNIHEQHFFLKMKKPLPQGDKFIMQSMQMPQGNCPHTFNIQQQLQQQLSQQQFMEESFQLNKVLEDTLKNNQFAQKKEDNNQQIQKKEENNQQIQKKEENNHVIQQKKEVPDLKKLVSIKAVEQTGLFNHSKQIILKVTVDNQSKMELKKMEATLIFNKKKNKNTTVLPLENLPSGKKVYTLTFNVKGKHPVFVFDADTMYINFSCQQEKQLADTVYVLSVQSSFSQKINKINETILSFFNYDNQFNNQKKKILKLVSDNHQLSEDEIINKFVDKFLTEKKKK